MSKDANKDAEVAKKRKNKLDVDDKGQEIKVPLQDQVPKKLANLLREKNIGQLVTDVWNKANANRAEWLDRMVSYQLDLDEFRDQTEGEIGPSDSKAFGVSNLHIPMPLIVVKNVHARFMQALTAELAPIVEPRRNDSTDRAPLVRALMEYTLKDWANYHTGVEDALDDFIWNWVAYGESILKVRWDSKFDKFIDTEPRLLRAPDKELVTEEGEIVRYPSVTQDEIEVEKTRTVFDGPIYECKSLEDVICVGHRDPQRADYVLDNYMLTASELWTYVDKGIFDKDAVEKVIKGGPQSHTGQSQTEKKQINAEIAGRSGLDTEADLPRYRIIEAYMAHDVNGNGINSEIVVWVHQQSGELLRATFLSRINKTSIRPYFSASYIQRPGVEHGLGLLEILHPLSIELDFQHNNRIDVGLFTTMPFGFYRASSSMKPETFKVTPGDLIPVEDPQNDVYYPNLGNRTSFGYNEEQAIQTMIERATGVNDLSLGVLSGNQGATRTATGARALVSESNTNLDVHLKRLNRMWKQVLKYTLCLLQQRLPNGFEFKVTGEDGQHYFANLKNKYEISGDFDFKLSPSSATSNPQIQQERANFVVQSQLNPIYLQLGIVQPQNLYEAYKAQLLANGIKEVHRYITKPPEYQYIYTPEEEANRVIRGMKVPVLPQADHAGFIAYVDNLMTETDPGSGAPLLAQYTEEDVMRLAAQRQQHEQMASALQQVEAQQANLNQQRINALQGVSASIQLPGPGQGNQE